MDREIAPEVRQKRVVKRGALALIALAAVVFFFAATVQWLRPSLERREVQIARVERGSVEATLQANGTVVPLVEQVVSSPVEARVLRIGRRAGDRVHAGDELLTLDTSAVPARGRAARRQRGAEAERVGGAAAPARRDPRHARAQIEQKKLDAQILHYTAEQKAKLRAEGLIAEQDALAAAAAAKKSDIELRQLEEALARAQRSRDVQLAASRAGPGHGPARARGVAAAARAGDAAGRPRRRPHLDRHRSRARRSGAATCWRAIADLSAYRVEASISDVHAAQLAAGMRAK